MLEEATTVKETHELNSRAYMPVEFKKVKRGLKEEFLWIGMTAFIKCSPNYFCKKCTGVWNSHDYTAGPNGRHAPGICGVAALSANQKFTSNPCFARLNFENVPGKTYT